MNSRPKYKTKQRDILVEYLKSASGNHITASDVCDYFKEQGAPIGQSTVYRRLESLVDEGVINKYIIDGNSPACFEYVGECASDEAHICFHCKCEKCGKLIHLHCDEVEEMQAHLYKEHKFRMDPRRTVFYGLCEECSKKEND
ncbi:MAG: transcriptional repressor [Lachnospiraceae bacterium]|nr:transcriptional repressor [Lachnospiraceae bacterium]